MIKTSVDMRKVRQCENSAGLIEMISEMNELIEKGFIKDKFDFSTWLDKTRAYSKSCFKELSEIVDTYIKYV